MHTTAHDFNAQQDHTFGYSLYILSPFTYSNAGSTRRSRMNSSFALDPMVKNRTRETVDVAAIRCSWISMLR